MTIKKILGLLVFLFILFSCKEKAEKLNCYSDKKNNTSVCWNSDTTIRIEYDNNSKNIYSIYFSVKSQKYGLIDLDSTNNKIVRTVVLNKKYYGYTVTIEYNKYGMCDFLVAKNDGSGETIFLYFNGNQTEIEVFQKLDNLNQLARIAYLTIDDRKDTSDYLFYKKTLSGYKILTDEKRYNVTNNLIDSIDLKYTFQSTASINFECPARDIYIPLYNERKVDSLKNSLFIETKRNNVIGELWSTSKMDPPYAFQLIYIQGDVLDRIALINKLSDFLVKNESGILNNNKDLCNQLISTGILTIEGGRVIYLNK